MCLCLYLGPIPNLVLENHPTQYVIFPINSHRGVSYYFQTQLLISNVFTCDEIKGKN